MTNRTEDLDDDDEPEDFECPSCGGSTDVEGQYCKGCNAFEGRQYREEDDDFDCRFADPGGDSALRAATPDNPRDRSCGTCGRSNVLTREDVALGYQCNGCAEALERGGY